MTLPLFRAGDYRRKPRRRPADKNVTPPSFSLTCEFVAGMV